MICQRVQKSSERSSQPQESAMAPVLTQRHSPSPHTQQDTETQAIQQHNREATVLKIQAKYGTITPQGQERLTFLQAKMADETQRKLNFGDRTHQNISNSSSGDVSATPPERNTASPIQAKLTIGQPGDKYEQEADRVAAQVVNQIHAPTTQREALPEEDEQQKKPEIGSIQRQTMSEELQMKSSGAAMTAPQDLETSIQQARGSGQPLADSIKQPMEQAFGVSFNGVKIHTDTRSHQLNQSIQARAFTTGQDVFFRQGEYNPGSRGGQELIAHELTHVVQQNDSAVQRKQPQTGFLASRKPRQEMTSTGETQPSQPAAKMLTSTLSEKQAARLDVIQRVPASDWLPGDLKFSQKRPYIKKGSERKTQQSEEAQEAATQQVEGIDRTRLEEEAETRLKGILSEAARNGGLNQSLLTEPTNVEKLKRPLRVQEVSNSQITDLELHRYVDWSEKVYQRLLEGANHLVRSINHWRRQLLDVEAPIDQCQITKVELEGSDLHEQGLGVAFVEFTKPLGGQIAAYSGDTNIKVVIKPEDRNIEKSLFGSEPTSLANQINNLAGLNTVPDRLIETIKMETSRDYGTMIEFIRGETSDRAGTNSGKNLNSLTEAIAFTLLAGLSDIHYMNVLWKHGKPYLIDADNALNAGKLQQPETQSGFHRYDKTTTDLMLKDWNDDTTTQGSAIQAALLKNAVPMIEAVRQAYAGKTGRVVPLHTNSWAQILRRGFYATREEGSSEDKIPEQDTRWAYANHLAEKLKDAQGSERKEPGLVGEAGRSQTKQFYNERLEASLIKEDFDKGQIPFYNYEYDTGHVIHNGQVIYHGQRIADAEQILRNKFRQ